MRRKLLFLFILLFTASLTYSQALDEDFESGTWPPTGWTEQQMGDPAGWQETTLRANSPTRSAYHNDDNVATGCDDWLITPVLDLSSYTTPQLTYWDNVDYVGSADQHNVMYSTDYSGSGDPTLATWTTINDVIGTEDTWVENGPYTLPTNSTVYIAYQYTGDYASDWFIDDVLVDEAPSCPAPTGLAHSNETANGADVTWTSVDSFFDIYFVVAGDPAPDAGTTPTVDDNSGTSYTWTGGSPATDYDWYVRTDCGQDNIDVSTWTGPGSFTTLVSCPAPTVQTESSITTSGADVGWTDASGSHWDIYVVATGDPAPVQGTTPTVDDHALTSYSWTGGSAATTYDWYVRSDCDEDNVGTSIWTGPSTFTTACVAATTFPWNEGFEGGIPPTCWSEVRTPSSSYGWISNGSGYSGNCARFDSYLNSSGNVSELITNTLDISSLSTAQLTFVFKNPTGGDFSVLLSTDGGATYPNTIWSGLTGQTDWLEKTADITAYIGSNVKIEFKGTSNYGSGDAYIYLDNVVVEEVPSCLAPTALNHSNETTSGSDVSWTSVDSFFDIYFVLAGDPAPDAGTTPTVDDHNATTYIWTGGTTNTDYDWYVRADCGQDNSNVSTWAGPNSFTTLCDAITSFPATEDFENAGSIPDCWTDDPTNTESWLYGTSAGYGPTADHTSGSGYLAWIDDSTPDDATPSNLLSPVFNTTSLTSPYLSFYYWIGRGVVGSTLDVDVYDGTTWQTGVLSLSAQNGWLEATLDMSTYSNSNLQLRFSGTEITGDYQCDIGIDDVTVKEAPSGPPTCTTPINPTDTETDVATDGNLSWDATADVTGYKIWFGSDGGGTSDPTDIENGTDLGLVTTHAYSGLEAQTTYYWKIVPYNANGDATGCSIWSFTTGDLTCTETASVAGNDDDPTIVTISSFSCTGGGTITGMTLDGNIGTNCPGWFSYDIYVNGSPIETGQCNQIGYDLTSYLPITSVSLQSVDEDAYSDGITLELTLHLTYEAASCPAPGSLMVSGQTTTTADLSWDAASGATGYNWEVVPTGDGQGNNVVASGSTVNTTVQATGLSPGTTYDAYVQNDCGSTYTGPVTFTTVCVSTTIPYFESFDGVTAPAFPPCLTVENANGDANEWVTQTGGLSSPNSASIGYNASMAMDDWFFTQGLDLTSGVTYEVSFAYACANSTWPEKLAVDWGNAPNSTAMSGTPIFDDNNVDNVSWFAGSGTFTPASTGTYYVGFHGYSDANQFELYVDDIQVVEVVAATTWTGGTDSDWGTPGNWSNGLPSSTTDVTIPAGLTNYPTLGNATTIGTLLIESGPGGDASILNDGLLIVTGDATVQRHITGGVWHDLSASTQGQTVNALYQGGNPDVWLRRYDEPTNTRDYITELTDPLAPGAGFEVWVEAGPRYDIIVNYTGALQRSSVTLNTSSTPALSYTDPEPFGYNLIGNPFASPIDLNLGTWSLTDVSTSFWVWDGTWLAWNTNGGGSGTLNTGIVPMGQGFFIQTTGASPSITIPMDARVHSGQAYYKNAEELGMPQLLLNVSAGEAYDKLNITFHKEAIEVFDMFDTRKLFAYAGNPPQIYSEQSGEQLTINGLPFSLLEKGTSVKIGFNAGEDGDHTIESNLIKLGDTEVWLEDLISGHIQSLNDEPVYKFEANTEDEPERFIIHFNPTITGIEDPTDKDLINIYAFDDKLCIRSAGDAANEVKEVWIYDLFGRTAIQTKAPAASFATIPVHELKGYVVVKIISESGVTTKKVYLK